MTRETYNFGNKEYIGPYAETAGYLRPAYFFQVFTCKEFSQAIRF
jgi:hypothetical protein